jgi:uncharacterized protein (TIGR00730 family)
VPEPRTPDEELIDLAEAPTHGAPTTDPQRLDRMRAELEAGFAALEGLGPAVSVFGSARTPRDSAEYATGRDLGRRLGEAGFAVITGGGPGAMEAANRGARDVGVHSVGLTIDLPFEATINRDIDIEVAFHYFFCRKVMFVRYASAFVVLPGGFGTLDELFEALTLIQTGKVHDFPVILVGAAFWDGLAVWLRDRLHAEGKIGPRDLDLFCVTDDFDEVVARIARAAAHHRA